jgi:hypothetical protein
MQPGSQDPRIDAMYGRDRIAALIALAILWITIVFVFWSIGPGSAAGGVMAALAIAGGLVLLFNSASILSMVKHYGEDKTNIYGLDLHYLDAKRDQKG